MEKIEGIIKGIFQGGGYIQQEDGTLYIFYESNLKELNKEILQRNIRVSALLSGVTIIQIKLKEDNMHWSEATLNHMLI